jgi:hypothetical protein
MGIIIQTATDREDRQAMLRIRQQVFEREIGVRLPEFNPQDEARTLHLLARATPGGEPCATLSIVDTTDHSRLHESFGLHFGPAARVARYTQLAVSKPYRGINIPIMLMLHAHYRFITPNEFHYTWMLFDANRAASSYIGRLLGFTLGKQVFESEFGSRRALVRDEHVPHSQQIAHYVKQYFEESCLPFRESMPGAFRPSITSKAPRLAILE